MKAIYCCAWVFVLRYGMSMGKVTKAFSYSFTVSHVSPSSMEGGTGEISD